jgi:UPF0755 protein
MRNSLASNAFTVVIVLILFFSALIGWVQSEYRASGGLEMPICFKVGSGENIESVSKSLKTEKLIGNPLIFRLGANYTEKSLHLKAGSFLIQENSSMREIVELITGVGQNTCGKEVLYQAGINSHKVILRELNPETKKYEEILKFDLKKNFKPDQYKNILNEKGVRYRIVFAEGITSWQIVEALKASDFLTGEIASLPSEGSLAPRSYEVQFGMNRLLLIDLMQSEQIKILNTAWNKKDPSSPLKTVDEALVLASIIEKETGVASERHLVASVFTNRMKKGMKLQTDPSVTYGITKGQKFLGRGPSKSELKLDTPYNTYIHRGLPPTPIANPGRLAIEAALNPEKTNYLFFVADGSGGHAFSKSLKEHNKNVREWRKLKKTN